MSRSLVLFAIAFGSTAQASADPLLEMMRAASEEGPLYAYETRFAWEDIDVTARIDPSAEIGQRIDVLSPSEADWSDKFREDLEKMDAGTEGDIWCNEFAEMVPTDASLLDQGASTSTYAFTPIPEPDADKTEQKMMKQLEGVVTLDKTDGAILSFQMTLPKPYKPAMVAKINTFIMDVDCERAPDGRTFIESFNMDVSGSAMMQSFDQSVSRQITKLLDPVS
ncbi:MAG: hypothetical protein AAFV37_01415 [Pseudomonadota bacterium]